MLNEEEKQFILYWEANRIRQKKVSKQWLIGLPTGMVFGLPILLNLFSGWDTQIKFMTRGQLNTLLIAVFIIITFIAIFTVKHRWDLNEQHYRELLQKQKKETATLPD
jgi:integral membrane sensor domain MASE1